VIGPEAREAWPELAARLRPFVARRLPREADVDDVLHDVLLRVQRGQGALRDDQRFGPWVYRVARSVVIDHLRAAARRPQGGASLDVLDEVAAAPPEGHDDRAAAAALAARVPAFVAALPAPYREALTLTELEGLTQAEAAARLGVSWSGMKSRVQRGRVQLRAALEACCAIERDVRGKVVGFERRPDAVTPTGCCA
jgi:RNA polymerase sigma-70 factor (ECF subfamily)